MKCLHLKFVLLFSHFIIFCFAAEIKTKLPKWTSIASDSSASILAATAAKHGIFLSKDGGISWEKVENVPQKSWYHITSTTAGDKLAAVAVGDSIYLSSDMGKTWMKSDAPEANWNNIVSSATGTYYFATAVADGIYRSADGGLHWESVYSDAAAWRALTVDATGQYVAALEMEGSIYVSSDYGLTWQTFGPSPMAWLDITSSTSGQFLAATVLGEGIYVSDDFGQTWTASSAPKRSWQGLCSDSSGSTMVAITAGDGIYLSRDFGASWQQTSASTEKWSTINCDETGETLLVTSEGSSAMYKSIDGGLTWFSSTASMHEISKNKKLTLFAEMNMLFSSIDHKVSLDSITLEPTDYPSGAPSASPSFIPTLNPTSRPSCRPFSFPSSRPSNQPTARPSNVPSEVPSGRPSGYPSGLPSSKPSTGPSSWPSSVPSTIPSMKPSLKPSSQPSSFPSGEPSLQPSSSPTTVPTAQPTVQPFSQPSSAPSARPTHQPTSIPTSQPSVVPSTQPTSLPSMIPSNQPTSQPSRQPSSQPSGKPSTQPTAQPSSMPSNQPTSQPSRQPSSQPTSQPSRQPTAQPSRQPSSQPSRQPIAFPTGQPSAQPTAAPIGKGQIKTSRPTRLPTSQPTSNPSSSPTSRPSFTLETDWANSLIALTANLTDPTYPTQITYNELVVNGNILQYGGCSSWATMLSGSLYYESLISKAASISVIVQNDLFSTSNPKASCKNATIAAKMVDFLLNPSSSGQSWTCGGEVWRAKLCDGSVSAPALCVGCSDPCDNARCLAQNPFFFGPCQSSQGQSCGNVLSSARTLVLSYDDRATIPKIRSYNVSAAQGAIDLSVAIDAAGSINCGIFLTGSIPTSSADIFAQNVVGVAYPQAVTLKFSGLFPSSEYKIYCIATGDGGSQTSLQTALSAGISAKTSCCASAEITIGPNYVYVGQQVNSAVSVKVVASPAVTTTLALFSKFGSSNSLVSLFPQETTVQGSQTVSFSLISGNLPAAGIVSIIPLIVNGNGDNYTVVFSQGRNSMNVLNSSSATPPPTLLNATLSSDGTSALLSFDSSTDLGGITSSIFSCTTLFTSIDTTLRCSWLNDNTLKMYSVSFGSSLKPGLQVTLKANQIKAKCVISNCNRNQYMASTAVRVQKPAVPSAPIPILTLPSLISRCSDLSVDFSSSSGSGNQAWKSIGFSVSSDNATLAGLIQRFLNQQGTQTGVITLPARFLVDGLLTISLKICNFLDACSQTSSNVVVTSNIVPTVSISGKQIQYYKISDTLQITGSGFVQLCSGNITRQNLVFSWSITPSGALSPLALSSTSKSKNIFALPASKLTANTWYQLQVSALYTVSKRSSFSSIKIFIQSGDIIPVVKGGSVRQVPVGKTLQLDASSSYDENTGTNKGLSFSWNCTQSAPVLSSVCPFTMPESAYVSILTILVPSTAEGRTAQVTATVISSDNRKATSSITVVAVSSKRLSVFLTTPVTTAINSLDKVQVSATISPANFTSFFWTCNDSSLSLVRSSLTAVNGSLQSPSASSLSLNLVLRQFSLTSGAGYMFGFTAQRGSVIVGSASIAIQVNGVPTPGIFTVSPTSGVELQQKFSMFAQYWSDPDLPLTYSFGFFSSSQFQLLQAASALALGSFSLPQGNSAQNYSLYAALLVFDKYQANSTVKQSIQVTANPSLTADALQNFLLSSFNSPSSDANSIAGTISTVGKILNSVNCSAAPSCSSLNRQECSSVANTCGTCLDGYIGASGSGNSKCFASAASAVVTTNFALDSLAAAVTSCSSDSNCGSFQACVSNQCQYLQQSCPQDCSGHGSCLYVSLYTSVPTLLQSCVVTDLTCAAQCRCNTGFYGADCSYTSQSLQTSQGNRLILLQQLSNLTSSIDLSLASLSSWISSLNSIVGGRSDELNPNTLALVSTLMQDFLGYADDVDTTFETLIPLLTAVDQILYFTNNYTYQQSTSQEQAYYRAQAVSLISSFAQSVYQGSLVGQEDIIYDQDYFQLKFHTPSSLELGSGKNTTVQTSLSVLESYNKKQPYRLQINNISNVQSGLMISLYQLVQYNFGNASSLFLNNPLYYEVSDYASVCGTDSGNCLFSVSLPNNEAQIYANLTQPLQSFITYCYGENTTQARTFTYNCAQGYQLKVRCNSTYYGTINSTCPHTESQPVCETLQNENPNGVPTSCVLDHYTQDGTVCMCSSNPTSRRRRLAAGSGNLQVGLSTTKQTEYFPSATTLQPFQPTLQPASAPAKTLSEKIEETFSHYRFYWIGFGVPILLSLISIFGYWLFKRRSKRIFEIDWKGYAEVLRMAIWPLLEVNQNYRAQLDLPPFILTKRLKTLLGKSPYDDLGIKNSLDRTISVENLHKPNRKDRSYEITSEGDLEVLRYLKRLLLAENDQLRQFADIQQSSEIVTLEQKEERRSTLLNQILKEETIEEVIEKEMERRKNIQSKDSGSDEGSSKKNVRKEVNEQPNLTLIDSNISILGASEPFLPSEVMENKKLRPVTSAAGMENFYSTNEEDRFSKKNPLQYFSPKRKRYDLNDDGTHKYQLKLDAEEDYDLENPSSSVPVGSHLGDPMAHGITPLSTLSSQIDSIAHKVPIHSPWNNLRSFGSDAEKDIEARFVDIGKFEVRQVENSPPVSGKSYVTRKSLITSVDDEKIKDPPSTSERSLYLEPRSTQSLVRKFSSDHELSSPNIRFKDPSRTKSNAQNPDAINRERFGKSSEASQAKLKVGHNLSPKRPTIELKRPGIHSKMFEDNISGITENTSNPYAVNPASPLHAQYFFPSTKQDEKTNFEEHSHSTRNLPKSSHDLSLLQQSELSPVRRDGLGRTGPSRSELPLSKPRRSESPRQTLPLDRQNSLTQSKTSSPRQRSPRNPSPRQESPRLRSQGREQPLPRQKSPRNPSPREASRQSPSLMSRSQPTPQSPPIYRSPPPDMSRTQPHYPQNQSLSDAAKRPAVLPPLHFSKPRASTHNSAPNTNQDKVNRIASPPAVLSNVERGNFAPSQPSPRKSPRSASASSKSRDRAHSPR